MKDQSTKSSRLHFITYHGYEDKRKEMKHFYKYYQTHTLEKTCKKLKLTRKKAAFWLRKILLNKNAILHSNKNNQRFLLEDKRQILRFARRYGIQPTVGKFNISRGLILRWIYMERNGYLNWEPDEKALKILESQTAVNLTRIQPYQMPRKALLKVLDLEKRTRGEIYHWTSIKMRYQAISELIKFEKLSLENLCAICHVSYQGYRHWLQRKNKRYNNWDEKIATMIKWVRNNKPDYYGIDRIQNEIKKQFHKNVGLWVIRKYLKCLELPTKVPKQKFMEMNEKVVLPKGKNLLLNDKGKPNFKVQHKNQVWVFDAAVIKPNKPKAEEINMYCIEDLYDRSIVAHSFFNFKDWMPALMQMLEKLFKKQRPKIIHSDNFYRVWDYVHLCELKKIKFSFSTKGTPKENGVIESFYSTFRKESKLSALLKMYPIEMVTAKVSEWIKHYNENRPHSYLKWQTPLEFRNHK